MLLVCNSKCYYRSQNILLHTEIIQSTLKYNVLWEKINIGLAEKIRRKTITLKLKMERGCGRKIVASTGGLDGSSIEHRTQLPDVNM